MRRMIVTPAAVVFAAILASLCCIGPVMLALAGVSGVAAFSMFDAYRPYLIGLTIVLIGLAFFFTYRRREVTCADGTCRVETAGIGSKIGVWSATFIAVSAIAFPYYGFGFTALSFSSGDVSEGKMDLSHTVTDFTRVGGSGTSGAKPLSSCASQRSLLYSLDGPSVTITVPVILGCSGQK
jgi:mercuric ion transport protein